MSTASAASPVWLFGPAIDLALIASGLTFLLLPLCVAMPLVWGKMAFLVLTFLCNYPHYMATSYRIYGSRSQIERYRRLAVHGTGLFVVAALLSHLVPARPLVTGLFTLAFFWSPYHYTGQNYGITMLYLRRGGVPITPDGRRLLYGCCLAALAMHLIAVNVILPGTADVPVLRLGIPVDAARVAWGVLLVVALGCGGVFLRRAGRLPLPALVLVAAQLTWFALLAAGPLFAERPGLGWLRTETIFPAIAFLHCAQYLGVTTYYTRREQSAEGRSFTFLRYMAIVTVGGALLWVGTTRLLAEVFDVDYGRSFLIMSALINLHHFVLDGAIWKLRDGRLARLLLTPPSAPVAAPVVARPPSGFGRVAWAGVAAVALVVAGTDVAQSVLLDRAGRLREAGDIGRARPLYQTVLALNHRSGSALAGLASSDLDVGSARTALPRWQEWVRLDPDSAEAQLGLGQTYLRLDENEKALAPLERAVALAPRSPNAMRFLADLYQARGDGARADALRARVTSLQPTTPRTASRY